jgi:hypothetical protein
MNNNRTVLKKMRNLIFISVISSSAYLCGQDTDNTYNELIEQFPFEINQKELPSKDLFTWELKADVEATGNAGIESSPFKGGHVRYSDAEVIGYYNKTINDDSGIIFGAGYSGTNIHWEQNPFFRKNHFNNLILNLSGYTTYINNWLWQGGIGASIDADTWGWANYNLYSFTLWGRYAYCDTLGVHVGLVTQTGIKKDKVQPIIGVDFFLSNCWKINLIYPVNMSIVYIINQDWSVALAGRVFEDRHRVGRNEFLSRAIVEYRNTGTELALNYTWAPHLSANVHVGSALGGDLKICNSNNDALTHLKLKPTAYVGGALDLKF